MSAQPDASDDDATDISLVSREGPVVADAVAGGASTVASSRQRRPTRGDGLAHHDEGNGNDVLTGDNGQGSQSQGSQSQGSPTQGSQGSANGAVPDAVPRT